MRPSAALLDREARRMARRPQTYALRVVGTLVVFGVLAAGAAVMRIDGFDPTSNAWLGRAIYVLAAQALFMLGLVVAPLLAAQSVIDEREAGALDLLALSRLSPGQLLRGHVVSRAGSVSLLILGAAPPMAVAVQLGGVGPIEVATAVLGAVAVAFLSGAFAGVVALFTASPVLAAAGSTVVVGGLLVALPSTLALLAWDPVAGASISPLWCIVQVDVRGFAAPVVLLGYAGLALRIGARVWERQIAEARVRRLFAPELWGGTFWWKLLVFVVVSGPVMAILALVAAAAGPTLHAAWQVVVWAWVAAGGASAVWLCLRIGTDVVHSLDGWRPTARTSRASELGVWRNPVTWREGRLRQWQGPMFGVGVVWVLVAATITQSGLWIIPGGLLSLSWANAVLTIGLTVYLAARSGADEARRGGIELLLLTGMPAERIVRGKVLGALLPSVPFAIMSAAGLCLGVPHLTLFAQVEWWAAALHGVAAALWFAVAWYAAGTFAVERVLHTSGPATWASTLGWACGLWMGAFVGRLILESSVPSLGWVPRLVNPVVALELHVAPLVGSVLLHLLGAFAIMRRMMRRIEHWGARG